MVTPRMLLAFTLLLTATHCVEIDDRELEEHGAGGGGLCEIDSDDDPCGVCIKQDCCTDFANCVESSDCQGLNSCLLDCGTTDACIDYCFAEWPYGVEPYAYYITCSTNYCSAACASGA